MQRYNLPRYTATQDTEQRFILVSVINPLPELPPAWIKILECLSVKSPENPSQLTKASHLAYSTVHGTVSELSRCGLIEVISSKKWRTGLESKKYDLTLIGLIIYLFYKWKEIPQERLNTLVNKYKNLNPKLFEKWKYFHDAGVEGIVSNNLFAAIKQYMNLSGFTNLSFFRTNEEFSFEKTDEKEKSKLTKALEDNILMDTLVPYNETLRAFLYYKNEKWYEQKRNELDNFLTAVARDPELSSLIMEYFEKNEEAILKEANLWTERREHLTTIITQLGNSSPNS